MKEEHTPSQPRPAEDPVVEITHLKKSFGNHEVLKDISLHLKKGENLVVLGKSGTGKSVLIKCIVRLIEPDEGSVVVLGENVLELDEEALIGLRKKIGFLFQSAALYDSMTVRENLAFPLRDKRFASEGELNDLIMEALENVGLVDTIDKMPSELSGGMRKRLGLARTLILKPQIILYDEPTTGLDPVTSREISSLILEVQQKYSASSLIITHDIACARMTANRLFMLNEGLCAAEGSFSELQAMQDLWIKDYFAA